jgi:hypothetical protein
MDARTTIAYTPNKMYATATGDLRAFELAMLYWDATR